MEWVADEKNDLLLRSYMERIWDRSGEEEDEISLSQFKNQLQQRSRGDRSMDRKRRIFRIGYAAASVLLLVVISYLGYRYLSNTEEIFQTAYGETLEVVLDDGSQVTLNANTTMTWNREWEKKGERRIRLEGEAYFSVTQTEEDRKSTRLNSSHVAISYAVFCLRKQNGENTRVANVSE